MSDSIRIMVVDDHVIFRRGVVELLEEQQDLHVIGEASNGIQGVAMAREHEPDVILMDVHMPEGDGIEAVRELKKSANFRVLMLTVSEEDQDLKGALMAGADGYLLKNAEPEELCRAIRTVAAGESVLSTRVTNKIMTAAARAWDRGEQTNLSPREHEVIALLAQGATTNQIAAKLVISTNTVKTHIHRILKKLDANNRAEAVARAALMGLLE